MVIEKKITDFDLSLDESQHRSSKWTKFEEFEDDLTIHPLSKLFIPKLIELNKDINMNESKKVALITGVTGQDGAYLSDFLKKGYVVHGIKRRSSSINTQRIDHIFQDPHVEDQNFFLHYGDMTDSTNLIRIIKEVSPDEIYNLAAMSHVRVSFDMPEYVADTDAVGTLRLLEAIRLLGFEKKQKFIKLPHLNCMVKYKKFPKMNLLLFIQDLRMESLNLRILDNKNYREAYDIFASNGILFNHESPLRGETFVTKKITTAVSRIAYGLQDRLYLGNLDAKRDWGHAKDYVRMMWLILQSDKPDDWVIATGKTTSVRDFVVSAFQFIGMEVRILLDMV